MEAELRQPIAGFFEVIGWMTAVSPTHQTALLPGAVEDLRVTSHADSELTVSWNPPTSGEAPRVISDN